MYTFFGSWTRINYTNKWTRKKKVKFCFLVNFFHFFLSCNSLEVRGINEEKLLRGSQIRQMFMTKTSCDESIKNEFENWLNGFISSLSRPIRKFVIPTYVLHLFKNDPLFILFIHQWCTWPQFLHPLWFEIRINAWFRLFVIIVNTWK